MITTVAEEERPLRSKLSEQAFNRLRDLIVLCRVTPGASLSQADLVAMSGQPRTPTREAALLLIDAGLLEVIPRRGYRVTPITAESASQLLDLYELLTIEAIRQASHDIDPGELKELKSAIEHPPAVPPASRVDFMHGLSLQLVGAITRRTSNVWLVAAIENLQWHVLRTWALVWSEPPARLLRDGYAPILDLLLAQDLSEEAIRTYRSRTAWIKDHTLKKIAEIQAESAAAASRWAVG